MKKLISFTLLIHTVFFYGQTVTTNTHAVGMEHNILFNATERYNVTQTGSATLNLTTLFDGKFSPSYTSSAPTETSPTIVEIENLPSIHTQTGGWVGWSTRYWQPKRFKIEGYNIYSGANQWVLLADYSQTDYTSTRTNFIQSLSKGVYTKLRYTFYSTYGADGRLGISELFFLHPEATTPYKGLLASSNDVSWTKSGNNTYYNIGNVGVGTGSPSTNFHINGKGGEPMPNTEDLQNKANFILSSTTRPPNGLGTMTRLYAGIGSSEYAWFQVHNGYNNGVTRNISLNPKGGNVAIGTTDPKGYKLAVAGESGIIAEEVTVKLQANWPDYVFEKEYNLPTLTEVENHIKEKGHLLNVPSAKEVKENGVKLGDINAKLLQKIEELTLYTIQQQKEIEKLLNKVEKLERKN